MVTVRELRPNTVNRKLSTLGRFLDWANDAGLLGSEQAPRLPRRMRQERLGPRWLSPQERRALIKAVERGHRRRDIAIVTVLLHTGVRVHELCALTWRDVRISSRKGRLVVRSGKGQKRREVPLNKDARGALLSIGYAQHAGSAEPIFQGQRGPLTPRGVQSLLKRYAQHAQIEDVSPHSLRHTFCKTLLDVGATLPEVAALAGHESLDTTRRYTEPSLVDLENTVERIAVDVD